VYRGTLFPREREEREREREREREERERERGFIFGGVKIIVSELVS
jgi:hypothetical protein